MSVTAAAGFEAAGVEAGLRSGEGPDLAVVVNRGPSAAAAVVFTSNRCTANPIIWSKQVIKDGVAYIQAGGGIVFDSDENEEYEETINKAAANMRCIEQAERLHWEEQQEEAGQVNIGSVVPEEGLGEASGKVEIGGG